MSHQTGIVASSELREYLAKSKDGGVRMMKIAIKDETLVLSEDREPQGSWEDDYDVCVLSVLEEKQPCYLLYRLDSKNDMGYEWIFICYSPDLSPVREKMLYAATRSTMKMEFGGGQIKEEVFGTHKSDVDLSGYKKHLIHQDAPAPLTYAEEELKFIKDNEVKTHHGVDAKHQTLQGVSFPMSDIAMAKVQSFRDKELTYVQLYIDTEKETIELGRADDTTVEDLPSRVPENSGRFHLFRFNHSHEGDYLESAVFIYSMPGFKCPIKERMLYSSCKNNLITFLEEEGIEITKKLEVDSGAEMTEEYIFDEIHPKKNVHRPKFAKPKGPGNRAGPRRLIKAPEEANNS